MCCLFGFVDYTGALSVNQKNRLIRKLSIAAEARGTDATGIAYNSSRGLQIYKRPLAAHRLHLKIPAEAHVVMGHTRMTTQGSAKKNYNNHPFFGRVKGKAFALAHNGIVWNDLEMRRTKHLPRTKVQTDSYVSVQLIEQQKPSTLTASAIWQSRSRVLLHLQCWMSRMRCGSSRGTILSALLTFRSLAFTFTHRLPRS